MVGALARCAQRSGVPAGPEVYPKVVDDRLLVGTRRTLLMRRSPNVTEVLPVLYLRGLSTGDFAPTLEGFFGSDAGLSASTISRLTEAWQQEHANWAKRDLSGGGLCVLVGGWDLVQRPSSRP